MHKFICEGPSWLEFLNFHWKKYRNLPNKVNIEMHNAKSKFFEDKIGESSRSNDPRKTWTLINSQLRRNNKLNNVSSLSVNENEILDSKSIAEAFNDYFINIGPKLAAECGDEQCINTEPLVIDDANQCHTHNLNFHQFLSIVLFQH